MVRACQITKNRMNRTKVLKWSVGINKRWNQVLTIDARQRKMRILSYSEELRVV
jgi:hypothetical protein